MAIMLGIKHVHKSCQSIRHILNPYLYAYSAHTKKHATTAGNYRHMQQILSITTVNKSKPMTNLHENHEHHLVHDATIHARLDYKKLAENIDTVVENVKNRFSDANPRLVVDLYHQRNGILQTINKLRAERNKISNELGKAKASMKTTNIDIDVSAYITRGQEIKHEIAEKEKAADQLQLQLDQEALKLPNSTHPDVPIGDENQSHLISSHGEKPDFSFTPLDHVALAESLDLIDNVSAAKVVGSRFVYLKNEAALLEIALVHYTLAKLRSRGFDVVLPPDLAHIKLVEGCGFQPRGPATQIYSIADSDLCLAATSEISLAGMKAHEVIPTSSLPLRYAAFSHCFRTETGHGGRITRGLYRLHQFSKVEMFGYCSNETQAESFFNEMMEIQIELYTELGLHFNIIDMATGDLGAPAFRKFDILAWMPGREVYGEICSTSMCSDYQARRLNIRQKEKNREGTSFVHTLNGTACAVPRVLIALLETYQQSDGSVVIPPVLRPYLGMQEIIKPK